MDATGSGHQAPPADQSPTDRSPTVLAVEGVWKTYPGVTALTDVGLSLRAGEVHALVGENGAGKSTLIKVLAGVVQPSRGRITRRGEQVRFASTHDSQAAGISVISQEFRLVPQLTVAENIALGNEPRRLGLVDRRHQRDRARDVLRSLGLSLSPERRVDSLTVGDQQMVEIARALTRDFDVLVMDEPTAALSESEADRLLGIVERLRTQGKAVLYVSHRLSEVFRVSDRITVLRDGVVVAGLATAATDVDEVVGAMLDRDPGSLGASAPAAASTPTGGVPALRVEGLRCAGLVEPVSLAVHPGEVLGIAGLVGSGRSELVRALYGAIPATTDVLEVGGDLTRVRSIDDAVRAGIVMLSEDRKQEGIFPLLSVLDNVVLAQRRWGRWLIDGEQDAARYAEVQERMRIKVDTPGRLITTLSGGNQQKALLGRALVSGCSVLLLNEPTRGVDIGAKAEIYQLVTELADSGVAVVVSSSEAAELDAVATRCLALYAGRVTGELARQDMSEESIVALSLGQGRATAEPARSAS